MTLKQIDQKTGILFEYRGDSVDLLYAVYHPKEKFILKFFNDNNQSRRRRYSK